MRTDGRWLGLALGVLACVLTACGGGGGGDSGSTAAATASPAPATAASAPAATASSPGTAASAPAAAASGIVLTLRQGDPVVVLSNTSRPLAWPYETGHRSLANGVLVIGHGPSANGDLLVGGYVLPGGRPGVQGLDPDSFAPRWSIATSSAPDVLEVSADGRTVYAGLCDETAIAQLDVATRQVVRQFQVRPGYGMCAGDIKVRPGTTTTIAATLVGYAGLAPTSSGVLMFRDGVRLDGQVLADFRVQGAVKLRFLDDAHLIGYSYFTSTAQFQWYRVDETGLSLERTADGALYSAWGEDFQVAGDRLVFSNAFIAPQQAIATVADGIGGCAGGVATALPDPGRLLCVRIVNQVFRQRPEDIEIELSEWSIQGERVLRRIRSSLRDAITIPTGWTPDATLLSVHALPGGQVVVHVWDWISKRIVLVGLNQSDLLPVASNPVAHERFEQGGLVIDRLDLPAGGLAHDPNSGATYAIVGGDYGPRGASLVRIDGSTRQADRFLPLDHEPRSISLSADGRYAYVASVLQVDQIDLAAWQRGWQWHSPEGAIQSMAVRPGGNDQLAVVTRGRVRWLVAGTERASVARRQGEDGLNYGYVVFRSADGLVEFVPSIVSGAIATYQIDDARGQMTAGATVFGQVPQTTTAWRSAFGLAFSGAGEVLDLPALIPHAGAPSTASYYDNPRSTDVSVRYANGVVSGGVARMTAFAPLAPDRWLATYGYGVGLGLELRDGPSSRKLYAFADPLYLERTRTDGFAAIDGSTAAFGQVFSDYLGLGALYFVKIKP